MKKEITVIILAAGVGSRMKSTRAKVMHILGGVPMIDHLLYKAERLMPLQIISVIAEEMVEVENHIKKRCDIVYQGRRLGSGDAVKSARGKHKLQSGVTLVLYGDTPLISGDKIEEMIGVVGGEIDICILGFEKYERNKYGKLVTKGNRVIKIIEDADSKEEQRDIKLCNSGVMAIRTEVIWELLEEIDNNNAQGEYYLTDIIEIANSKGLSCSYIVDNEENLQGANTKGELAELERVFQGQKRLEFLEAGVQLIDPTSIYFSLDTEIGKDVVIYPNVHILAKSEIKDRCTIFPFTVIEGGVIGEDSRVGPYARIRPDTVLQGNNHIGNFVEIKKSDVGVGTKINHLTYIGDSIIGEKTNIGAGTITCNYDGKNKHQTIIGDNCFIGSNSSLVAPIEIKDKVTIGAGSVITKSVEEGVLAIARARQVSLAKKDN